MNLALLSLAYAQAGRPGDAVRAATAAGAMPSDSTTSDLVLGRAMLLAQQPADAETFFRRAAAAAPDNPEPLTRLAIVKAATGDLTEAERTLTRVVGRWPSYAPAVQALERVRASRP
jgi:Flp pilus assembly protein TadD